MKVELMYDIPSYFIAAILLAAMLVATLAGYGIGQGRTHRETEERKSQTQAVQASLLGLLALLLGFSFSLALARFDERSVAVVDEANAIGTAFLRTDLLPEAARNDARALLMRYGVLRLESGAASAADDATRADLAAQSQEVFAELWALAADTARTAPNPATVAFANALNDMIDAFGSRDAKIKKHVPEIVLYLLFGTFVLLGAIVGYGSGTSGIFPGMPIYGMMTIIVLLVFLIIDLDRPRRGLIEVNQSPMRDAVAAMQQAR
jgi:hypothetical protein